MSGQIRALIVGALLVAALSAVVVLSGVLPLEFAASDSDRDGEVEVRVQARETELGRVEVRAQSRISGSEWTIHTPEARFLPVPAEPGSWYSSNPFVVSVPATVPEVSDPSRVHAPGAFTQSYVERALEMYRVLGREATFEYYNSRKSIDGQWYLFVHHVDGTRLVNGARADRPGWLGSNLHGTGVDVTGYDYTADTLSIETSGWIAYVFPNPDAELQYQRKHSWIVRQGDLLFGSGWYDRSYDLAEQNPAAYARALVQDAIDRHDADGREAVIAYHNSPESVDGEWYVSIYELDGTRLAHPYLPLGENLLDGGPDVTGRNFREEFIAIEDRGWVSYVFLNPDSGEQEQKHTWVVRHEGLLFTAGWYEGGAYEAPES